MEPSSEYLQGPRTAANGPNFFTIYGEHYEHEETTPSNRNVDRDRYGAGSADACFENANLDLHSMNPHSTFLSILVALIVLYIVAMYSERRR